MSGRAWLVSVLMLVFALGAAACGGSDGESADPGSETGSAATDAEQPDRSLTTNGDATNGGDAPPVDAPPAESGEAGVSESAADVPPRSALTVGEAIESLGPIAEPWPGPIFTEYVCNNVPNAHVQAVVAVIPAGEVFEFGPDRSCRLSTPSLTMVITAIGAENHEERFAIRQELLSGEQPVTGFGDQAFEIASESRQTLLILDGDIVWQLEGGHPDELPREQFHAFATVLLTRFDPTTRIDAVAEPLTADELAKVTTLLEDWHRAEDAYFDGTATDETLLQFATEEAAVAVKTSRNSNQRKLDEGIGGTTYQIQQLETVDASWLRGTSRGDVIVVAECVISERGQPEGRDPLVGATSVTLQVIANGDQWFVDEQVEGSVLRGTNSCTD